ncbi:hypothetical protein [Ferrimonas balearica]|uniref:hypothetical protein n=1 Tax=Ferrimonas balearica TaxID=44012 RepID=UPI001C9966C7|nr:hypothetical protein [Ferrimonas balearica]MBY5993566.1 hypothetical protein [Ferrimonas balearica]
MSKRLLSAALALALVGCSSDDKGPTPPSSVPVDEATELALTLTELAPDGSLSFTLDNGAGLAVTGASDYSVTFLGYAGAYDTAFSMPWHTSDRFGCGQEVPDCVGTLEELEPGVYHFSPDREPQLGDRVTSVKLSIRVHGALASTPPNVMDAPQG